ncbi:urease accessory protein UreD [Oculatella sp. LEGE 06141]|uniref:urease accessory protein UreD n=1 Tax=Oculatella sp. LEGE 06141 TaxID=1828648 RepID=UPI0018822367|nr:urease accessory protein UreD [Oculatella sp. LEGE 06141]MBE9180383.1 urease accessory protein UreD [Oculatella sp. LEGE 06141]
MVAQLIDSSIAALDHSGQNHLAVQIGLDQYHRSFVQRQYATYPFRLSRSLRLDPTDAHRAYLYIMNSSPGLLAGDRFRISVRLSDRTSLYLTDQSATKVHQMAVDQLARIHYDIEVGAGAGLEFVPEPTILYRNASLEQTMRVTLASTGSLFLSDVMVPGRLARGECFHFHRYFSRLRVCTPDGALVFNDAMQIKGEGELTRHAIFASQPILASVMIILPGVNLHALGLDLEQFAHAQTNLTAASSPLPNCNGLLVRVMSSNVPLMKTYINQALNRMRHLNHQPALPEIPK